MITKGGRRNERLFFDYSISVCAGSASALSSLVEARAQNDREKGASDHERARQAERGSRKAILKASEPDTQEWCSKLVGTYDKKKVSSNYNADVMGVGKGQGTSSSTEEKRIIKPEEFAYLPRMAA